MSGCLSYAFPALRSKMLLDLVFEICSCTLYSLFHFRLSLKDAKKDFRSLFIWIFLLMLWGIISLKSRKTVLRHMNQKENIVLKNHMTIWEPLIIYITASKSSLESFGGKSVTNKSHLWWQTLPLIHIVLLYHSADPLSRSCRAESWNQY